MVPSTLSGEAQSLACGLGMLEWAMLHISEALDGPVTLRGYEEALRCRTPTAVVDCKSLYDHATAPTSPGGTDDKREFRSFEMHVALDSRRSNVS